MLVLVRVGAGAAAAEGGGGAAALAEEEAASDEEDHDAGSTRIRMAACFPAQFMQARAQDIFCVGLDSARSDGDAALLCSPVESRFRSGSSSSSLLEMRAREEKSNAELRRERN